jgi:hypothetical protein
VYLRSIGGGTYSYGIDLDFDFFLVGDADVVSWPQNKDIIGSKDKLNFSLRGDCSFGCDEGTTEVLFLLVIPGDPIRWVSTDFLARFGED